MNSFIKPILMTALFTGALSGCLNKPVKPVTPTTVDAETVTYIVPSSDNIIRGAGLIKNLDISGFRRGKSTEKEKLFFKRVSDNKIVAHRRTDNGHAGSGIEYLVNYDVKKNKNGYSIELTPVHFTTYQQGFIGKFDVPVFTVPQVTESLKNGYLSYQFEFNSKFSTPAIKANFNRLANAHRNSGAGQIDPMSKRIIPSNYDIYVRGKKLKISVSVDPYRDGSKVIVNTRISAIETSKNTIDFSILEKEVKNAINKIINS